MASTTQHGQLIDHRRYCAVCPRKYHGFLHVCKYYPRSIKNIIKKQQNKLRNGEFSIDYGQKVIYPKQDWTNYFS